MDGGDLYAPRDWSSPLRALLGWRVLPSHSDAPCHLLINVGGTLSTGLRYVGDCKANLSRMVERVLRSVLLNCGMGETVVERFLEDDVSSMSGSYSGRIFQDGLLESVRHSDVRRSTPTSG